MEPSSIRGPLPLPAALILGLAAALALGAPRADAADFRCDRSVAYHGERCEGTVVFSIGPTDTKAICAEFTKRLERACRPDWDKFAKCSDFAARFEDLLVRACLARGVQKGPCESWGQAFAVNPLNRCLQGRFTY